MNKSVVVIIQFGDDIGGYEKQLDRIREMVGLPLRHPRCSRTSASVPLPDCDAPPVRLREDAHCTPPQTRRAHPSPDQRPGGHGQMAGESESTLRRAFEANQHPGSHFHRRDRLCRAEGDQSGREAERRVVSHPQQLVDGSARVLSHCHWSAPPYGSGPLRPDATVLITPVSVPASNMVLQ